jgi:hypothetical protein
MTAEARKVAPATAIISSALGVTVADRDARPQPFT